MYKNFIFFLFCHIGLFATELHLFNGYRQDKLTRTTTMQREVDGTTIPSIELWQVGVNGKLANKCLPVFISGYGYWGMGGGSAILKESTKGLSALQRGRANLNKARTYDYQVGAGYQARWRCFSLEVGSGYSCSRQKISTKSGQIALGEFFEDAALYRPGYKTTTTWRGPWIGLEGLFCRKGCRFSLGYEYHFAHYEAKHSIPQSAMAQLEGFASKTTSPKAYGNVVFLSGSYRFCGIVDLGLYFKYQDWQASDGTLRSRYFASNGYPLPVKVIGSGEWTSYVVGLNAGVLF